eukprot:1155361-Pelagomonas_calceolata.AAC.4
MLAQFCFPLPSLEGGVLVTATAGAMHTLWSMHLRFVSACRYRATAACSSKQQRGSWCGLEEACRMQLILWREVCMGRWWSGGGSGEEGPSTERRQGRHGYKASGGWCLWSGGRARRALYVLASALRAVSQASTWSAAASS